VQSYKEARAALIAAENSQAFDGQAVAAASAIEKRANELVGAIIKRIQRKFIASSKTRMDDSGSWRVTSLAMSISSMRQLLKVAEKMPKGPISITILTPACAQNS
jgi:hypothetical protein